MPLRSHPERRVSLLAVDVGIIFDNDPTGVGTAVREHGGVASVAVLAAVTDVLRGAPFSGLMLSACSTSLLRHVFRVEVTICLELNICICVFGHQRSR